MEGNMFSQKTRRRLLIAALVIGLPLLGAGECKGDGNSGDPKDPNYNKEVTKAAPASPGAECANFPDAAVPPNLQQKRYITIWTCLETAYGPYTVYYHATDINGNTLASTEEAVVEVAKPFNRIIGYDTGQKVSISIQIRPARPGAKNGYIYAKDGPANIKSGRIDGAFQIRIDINAAR
jgi:hypothetical protein